MNLLSSNYSLSLFSPPLSMTSSSSSALSLHSGLSVATEKSKKYLPLSTFDSIMCISDISIKCLSIFFDKKDLLRFEMVRRSYRQFTSYAWKGLRVRDYYTFDWADCKNKPGERENDRQNYLLGAALTQCLFIKQNVVKPRVAAKQILSKFGGMARRFPHFGYYINLEVRSLLKSAHPPFAPALEQIEISRSLLHVASETTFVGDRVLQAIIEYNYMCAQPTPNFSSCISYMESAIDNGASCCSLFALNFVKLPADIKENLALRAARQRDYRALDILASNLSQAKLLDIKNGHGSNSGNTL